MKIFAAAILVALPLCGADALAQSTPSVSLASVAHKLGLAYSYLGTEDAVSLYGHGIAVTVRPGEPFFYINDRSEPIRGGTPVFRGNDIFVPAEFVGQLSMLEKTIGSGLGTRRSNAADANNLGLTKMAPTAPRLVTRLVMGPAPGSEDVALSGDATPNALVSIVLKAISSPLVPTIFLNRSFAVADSTGKFSLIVSTAPEYFNGSEFVAEASGVDDTKAVVARYSPPKR